MHSEQPDKVQKRVSEETEIAVEVLDASCIVKSTAQDTTRSKGQNQNSTKGQCCSYSTVCDLYFNPQKYVALVLLN